MFLSENNSHKEWIDIEPFLVKHSHFQKSKETDLDLGGHWFYEMTKNILSL